MQPPLPTATKNEHRGKDVIFYDGTCGLCHWFVKWVLRHDKAGVFRLSPLQGETIQMMLEAEERANLPDSAVVLTADSRLLLKSEAARYVMQRLGLRKRAALLGVLPRPLADLGYDAIARYRYHLFGRNKGDMCPLVPADLRERFLP
jgi:predicted DCC family thiol-disulfide oxidoreductase YuxK